jgi:phage baseplate assembly protein W
VGPVENYEWLFFPEISLVDDSVQREANRRVYPAVAVALEIFAVRVGAASVVAAVEVVVGDFLVVFAAAFAVYAAPVVAAAAVVVVLVVVAAAAA